MGTYKIDWQDVADHLQISQGQVSKLSGRAKSNGLY